MGNIDKLNELLLTVQKPGRYVGGEWNAVKKEWTADKVKVCLAFPDVYEVGMSYLGTKILYGILNDRADCLAERVFAPWTDFEAVLRNNNIPLFSLESRKPLKDFDIIGFSFAYELTYTNILNILDLGGIPLRTSERTDADPLIIAGGPSCFNPEPMADFIDAFVIGDGEEAIGEIVEVYKKLRFTLHASRPTLLRELAKIPGVYVPSFYAVEYNTDGTLGAFTATQEGVPAKINKRYVKDLDSAYYPTNQIVPNIGIVHDRIALEVMRGCTHACKFCQAAMTYRPCRERSRAKVLELARASYAATGHDEISLLSLSSVDYSHLRGAIEDLNAEFAGKAVSISVPSLRIEEMAIDIPLLISKVKKAGLTFAPEAGSEALRKCLNKDIDIEKLYDAARESFKAGWKRVKLYFMIGLPGETDDDIVKMAEMIRRISDLKKDLDGRPAQVAASVNAFVPKPHTAFQREAMVSLDELERKKRLLRQRIASKHIELDFHKSDMSYLEAVLSRGDRRLADVIAAAWRAGARFDAWQEKFNLTVWGEAFILCRIDRSFYVNRKKNPDEALPWDFIVVR